MIINTTPYTGEQVAKRIFWLAWQACGGPFGMGILQNHPGANEDDKARSKLYARADKQ